MSSQKFRILLKIYTTWSASMLEAGSQKKSHKDLYTQHVNSPGKENILNKLAAMDRIQLLVGTLSLTDQPCRLFL